MCGASLRRTHALICALPLACAACSGAPAQIELEGSGGEAWTFGKAVRGRVTSGACDQVVLTTDSSSAGATRFGREFHATVTLQEGKNEIRAECRRAGRTIARSEPQHWTMKLPDRPTSRIRLRATSESVYLDAGASEEASGARSPIARFEWFARPDNPAPLLRAGQGSTIEGAREPQIRIAAPATDGEYYVRLKITDALGRSDESAAVFRVSGGRVQEIDVGEEHPAWVDRAIVYGAAPFFFRPGDFNGVRERLDEIAALGATVIWLSPITLPAPGDFGYAVADHFRIRPSFGDEMSFRALVREAHALGLRVLIDFVPNHFSTAHRYYEHVERDREESPYYEWFDRDARGEVTHYFEWTHLKNLEYDNPEVQNHVVAAFAYWVREFDVDGFRVDATWAVRERAPEFWPKWRAELKRIDPDLFLLAEASARDPYYVAHGFDAAYDWTYNLGEWAWRDVFVDGRVDVARLRDALTNDGAGLPPDTLTFRFLNNNDTGPRFITRHGAPLAKAAATLLFTAPGVPLIYNGDEVGAEFLPYEEGPPIEWRDPHGLRAHYTQLTKLRRTHAALHGRELELLSTSADDSVLAFRRPGPTAPEDLHVVLNFSGVEASVRVSSLADDHGADSYLDLLSGKPVKISRSRLTLAPYQGVILARAL